MAVFIQGSVGRGKIGVICKSIPPMIFIEPILNGDGSTPIREVILSIRILKSFESISMPSRANNTRSSPEFHAVRT